MANIPFNAFMRDLLLLIKRECPSDKTTSSIKKKFKFFSADSTGYIKRFCDSGPHPTDMNGWLAGTSDDAVAWEPIPSVRRNYLKNHLSESGANSAKALVSGMALFAGMHADEVDCETCAAVCSAICNRDKSRMCEVVMDDDALKLANTVIDWDIPSRIDAVLKSCSKQKPERMDESSSLIRLAKEISSEVDVASILSGGKTGGLDGLIGDIQKKLASKLSAGEFESDELMADAQRILKM